VERVLLIGFGGAIGTVLRYVTSGLGDGVSIFGHVRGAGCVAGLLKRCADYTVALVPDGRA
jgi:hypothetical protein